MSGQSHSEPLTGTDAAWLRLESAENLLVITALAVFEDLPLATFCERLSARFLKYNRFLKRPVLRSGVYFWEADPDFDLKNHVQAIELPGAAGKASLQRWLGEMMSTPLDPARPLWEFHYIANYSAGPAIVMRVHHCYADGLALIGVFDSLTDGAPEAGKLEEMPVVEGLPRPRIRHRVIDGMEQLFERLEKAARLARSGDHSALRGLANREFLEGLWQSGLEGFAELIRIAALPRDPVTGLRPSPGVLKACAWSEPMALEDFKAIARVLGCSINDVLVCVVSGGLRRALLASGPISDDLLLHGTLPVNLRPLQSASELTALGNRFGTVFVPLSLGIANPLERLYKTKHDMLSLRQSGLPVLSHWIMGLIGLLPGGLQDKVMDQFSNKSSLVLSNVPGSRDHRYLAGHRICELMFWVPQAGDIGLGVSLLSYAGQVQIGVNADLGLAVDADTLIDYMQAEVDLYRDLSGSFPASMRPVI